MVEFSKNKWKYSTINLLAVLAIGFSFPQASAHVTNNVMHMVTHIFDNTEEIKETTNDIESQIEGLEGKVVKGTIDLGNVPVDECEDVTVVSEFPSGIKGRAGIALNSASIDLVRFSAVYGGVAGELVEIGESTDATETHAQFDFISDNGQLFIRVCDLSADGDDAGAYRVGYSVIYTTIEDVTEQDLP